MVYTAYTEKEWKDLPPAYRKKVVGITESDEVIQVPRCPECGSEMMEQEGYLSCVECAACRRLRILR